MKKLIHFILHCRAENVLAVSFSLGLLVLAATTRMIHTVSLGMLDVLFLLLPVFILCVKFLLSALLAPETGGEGEASALTWGIHFFRPLATIVSDWFPFFLLSACYYSLYSNFILQVNPHTADAVLSQIDAAMFGDQPAILLQPYVVPAVTDVLNLIYLSHVIVFPGVALYFYVKKDLPAFRMLMFGFLNISLMGVTSYILVPAVGPESYFASRFTVDLTGNPISQSVNYIISNGRVAYDCFPSLHVAIPLLMTLYLRRYAPRAFWLALCYVALMICATIYLRYHYVIDVIAAFFYVPTAYFLTEFMLRRWPGGCGHRIL